MAFDRPRGNARTKWAAIGVVVLLEFSAVFYLYGMPVVFPAKGPRTFPASLTSTLTTTTTTSKTATRTTSSVAPAPKVTVVSALVAHDALYLNVKNEGPGSTSDLSITSICSPPLAGSSTFQNCLPYSSLAGKAYTRTFVLPQGRQYAENLTGVCVIVIAHCAHYYAVANYSYYFMVKFDMANGQSTPPIQVTAKGNDTIAPGSSINGNVQGTNLTMRAFSQNLSGSMNVFVIVNDTTTAANFTASLNAYAGKTGFTQRVIANQSGCGGNLINACAPDTPFPITVTFSLVNTGVTAGTTYAVVVRDLTAPTPVYFAFWTVFPPY